MGSFMLVIIKCTFENNLHRKEGIRLSPMSVGIQIKLVLICMVY